LLRDYYSREFGIEMPPVTYFDEWWNKGEDFYMQHSGVAGFYPVTNLKKYDVIAFRLFSHVFNHSAIYLGDNKILHHVGGKFSCIEEIRPAYVKMMFGYFRHKDLINNG
jgi:cell wall-associated NlpC family hydrolase